MSLTSSNSHMADRHHGICQGSLWRQCAALSSSAAASTSSASMSSVSSSSPYKRGTSTSARRSSSSSSALTSMSPHPTTSGRINEYCVLAGVQLSTYESMQAWVRGDYPVATFTIVGATSANSLTSGSRPTSFRLVTNQGTQVTCTAPTRHCRDTWLAAFQASLEGKLHSLNASTDCDDGDNGDDDALLPKLKPKHYTQTPARFCRSCGKVERLEFPLCGKAAPLPAYGLEERCDLCKHCLVSQGMVDQANHIHTLYASASFELNALLTARRLLWGRLAKREPSGDIADTSQSATTSTATTTNDDSQDEVDRLSLHYNQREHQWVPSDTSTWLFEKVLVSQEFVACKRVSPILESLCHQYLSGIMGLLEFLEQLDQAVGSREGTDSLNELKKQAFRVAGDMGTAMKMLQEQAVPNDTAGSRSFTSAASRNGSDDAATSTDTDLLQCILEFLLELAADGELQSLAFFFPQICAIHLRMLPPRNHADLLRVELMEDFLLTLCCRYSIQLGVSLIWTHLADLDDAWTAVERSFAAGTMSSTFTSSTASSTMYNLSPSIQQACSRRFAVLRFLCELESLLFDFDSGWGGGSVTVGHLIQPSKHQVALLKGTVKRIQRLRVENHKSRGLSQSVRMDKLRNVKQTLPPEMMAEEALRVTKNADYLSSHLVFTKRLCDIAEKLRFMNVDDRKGALQSELNRLNASGSMGGDPLNTISSSLSRVVRIPSKEGHVFRSKERTPVLLLVEILDEGVQFEVEAQEREQKRQTMILKQKDKLRATTAGTSGSSNGEIEEQEEKKGDESTAVTAAEAAKIDAEAASEHTEPTKDESDLAEEDSPAEQTEQVCEAKEETKHEAKTDGIADGDDEDEDDEEDKTTELKSSAESEDEEFHSAAGSINEDIAQSELETPRPQPKVVVKIDSRSELEGSITETEEKESNHALRRFDSPKGNMESTVTSKTPSKEMVEQLVTSVVSKHLQLPELAMSAGVKDGETKDGQENPTGSDTPTSSLSPRNSKHGRDNVRVPTRKIGSLSSRNFDENDNSDRGNETRRKVLDTIMSKGASHTLAASVSGAAQHSLQALERKRAVALLLKGDSGDGTASVMSDGDGDTVDGARQDLLSLGIESASSDGMEVTNMGHDSQPTEEDEAMEAIRLLLIQYRVAQGQLTADAAAQALAPGPRNYFESLKTSGTGKAWPKMKDPHEMPQIDSGAVDSRLAGCGILPPAVLQAMTLWKGGMVSNGELLELVKKDLEYAQLSLELEVSKDKLSEDSAFWGRFAFGERWAEKRSRIAATSPQASKPGWDLVGVIIKSNDDLRQEAFVMQLIELCREAFQDAGLELWLHPYRILSTGRTTGIIEMVRNAMSFDALKKRPGYGSGGLRGHLRRMTEFSANPEEAFKTAQANFVRSLAAYSLLSHLFLFKDRHNGNILLDTAGHVIHIDFGFVFGIAPGGSFSLEMSTPFKLTDEMVQVMGGVKSTLFSEFVTLFCCGFLALQAHCDIFMTIVEITCSSSTFNCFDGRSTAEIVQQMRDRFRPELNTEETIAHALDLIKDSVDSYGTSQYDYFQYLSQGIAT